MPAKGDVVTAVADRPESPAPEPAGRGALATRGPTEHQWHVDPVPPRGRILAGIDAGVLWTSLGLSLLGLVLATSFVPALGFRRAVLAAVVGSAVGAALLGLLAVPGAQTGEPAMVLLRRVLGGRGSVAPTVANVVQNVGFAAFELFVIAAAAQVLSQRAFGARSRVGWVVAVGLGVTLLAALGPLTVVRRYLKTVVLWAVLATSVVLTVYALTRPGLPAALRAPGTGPTTVAGGIDLAVALAVSWVPLAADYSRFGSRPVATGVGTGVGFFLAQASYLVLGMVLVLATGVTGDTAAFAGAVLAAPAGLLLLGVLVVAESDKVFANVYSTAVSAQNLLPRLPGRALTVAIGLGATLLAALVADLTTFTAFVTVVGSVFVPLTGVFLARWFLLRRRTAPAGVAVDAMVIWVLGSCLYNAISPGSWAPWRSVVTGVVGTPLGERWTWLGASGPTLLATTLLMTAVGWRARARGGEATVDSDRRGPSVLPA